ncbi:MAG: MFS transporter [Desulfocucumaceae bacterium]
MLNIILLGLTSLLTDISTEMVYPLIPFFLVSNLGVSPAIVGIIEGFAESLASLLKVFSGYISDRLNRRKSLAIFGYSFSAISKVLLILASSWTWVLWGRIGDRFGKGIRTAPRDAIIALSSDPAKKGKAFGLHRAMDTFGAVIGITLAYYFFVHYKGSYRPIFIWSLIPALLGVLVLFLLKESKEKKLIQKPLDLRWSVLDPKLKGLLIIVLVFALGNSSNFFLLLRARDMGFSEEQVILLYLVFNIVYALFSYPAGVLSDSIGRRTLLVAGYFIYGLVYLAFAFNTEGKYLWLLFGVYGLYNSFTEGIEKALIADIAPVSQRATMIGLHAALVGFGLLPASFAGGLLWNYLGPQYTFIFGGLMGLAASLAMAVALKDMNSLRER